MKMSSSIFWGIILILIGLSRLFSDANDEHTVIFSQRTITSVEDGKEYNVIFGNGIFDLRNFQSSGDGEVTVKMNTVFGSSEVLINDSIPIKINAHTVFAGCKMPDGNTTAFGEAKYNNTGYSNVPLLKIESNTVFGGFLVRKK
jgi:hypothetical protein